MRGLSALVLALSVLSLNACASIDANNTAKKQQTITPADGLAAQELQAGECGVFFWTDNFPRTFVFFQKQGSAEAKYYAGEAEITLSTNQNTNNMDDAPGLDIAYSHDEYIAFHVKGDFADRLEGGRRITNARIKAQKPGAWEAIQPVSGVYVCR
ncbi:MAG: hypothetical protein L3J05_06550 [Robiginitomaculum sp.]|nr:hypothetical protein [Robiginitomaculum sp.]